MSNHWIEGSWNGREPVIPDDMPDFVWIVVYYDWLNDPKLNQFNKNNLKTFLHSLSLSLEFIDEDKGASITPPPKWIWQTIDDPPKVPKKKKVK